MLAPSAKYTKKHGIFMLQKRAWMHRGFSRGDFLIFYCFMVLCFDFELWTHFSWEFQGGHICTNSFKHVFIALRAESRVLGREELTMWPRHKKIETSSQPPRCCSWILHIAYLPSQLPSWLHFLNKASTNTKEYYVSYLNTFFCQGKLAIEKPKEKSWVICCTPWDIVQRYFCGTSERNCFLFENTY